MRCAIVWDTYDDGTGEVLASTPNVNVNMNFIVSSASGITLNEDAHAEPPTVLGSVVGYRAWQIGNGLLLYGTGGQSSEPWSPGTNEARCSCYNHRAPTYGCGCGLYALARFSDGAAYWSSGSVVGAVEAWADPDEAGNDDRFFLHEDGFRAQYAKIVLLATDVGFSKVQNDFIRKVLAPHYGVDVVRKEHLEDAAKEHGQLVPKELLRWAKDGNRKDLIKATDETGRHPSGFFFPSEWTTEVERLSPLAAFLAKTPARRPRYKPAPRRPF